MSYRDQFFTVDKEFAQQELPCVSGTVPDWLQGTLVRNGPGSFAAGRSPLQHWFDGLAMLHGFAFNQGRVTYTNKFLQSPAYIDGKKHGRNNYKMFYTEADYSPLRAFIEWFRSPRVGNNTAVSVVQLGERYFAMTETSGLTAFDLGTLDTIETTSLTEGYDNIHGMLATPHPHYDFARRELININISLGKDSEYRYYAADAVTYKPRLISSVKVDFPGYIHGFGLSENYIIHFEFPLVVFPLRMRFGNVPYIKCYKWKPERGTNIRLINRETGKVDNCINTDPAFAFHFANCYEEEGAVIVDVAVSDDATVIEETAVANLSSDKDRPLSVNTSLYRYRIPLSGQSVERTEISSQYLEMPTIDYRQRNTNAYRYVYGVGLNDNYNNDFNNQLIKLDTNSGKHREWFLQDYYPSEPIFVPSPDRKEEDEGVLLSVVSTFGENKSFLLICNAGDLSEIGRLEMPHNTPMGFHGQFLR